MPWQVHYAPRAAHAMRKLDKPVACRVLDGIERLSTPDDPTAPCKALSVTIALDLGHRSAIYDD